MSKDDPKPKVDFSVTQDVGSTEEALPFAGATPEAAERLDGTVAITGEPRAPTSPFAGSAPLEGEAQSSPRKPVTPFELALGQRLAATPQLTDNLDETVALTGDMAAPPPTGVDAIVAEAEKAKAEGEANVAKARDDIEKVRDEVAKIKEDIFARLEALKAKKAR